MAKTPTPEEIAEIQQLAVELGCMIPMKPFVVRDMDSDAPWAKESEAPLPFEITSFLAQADEVSPSTVPFGCRCWEVKFEVGTQFDRLYAHFLPGILQCGGALIWTLGEIEAQSTTPAFHEILVYPFNWEFGFHLLESCGFGRDPHLRAVDGLPVEPHLNTPERVIERRRRAIRLITDLHAEAPVALRKVYPEGASLCIVNQPPAKIARKWADAVWQFFHENYSAVKDPVRCADKRNMFTHSEARRDAKHGTFSLGDFG